MVRKNIFYGLCMMLFVVLLVGGCTPVDVEDQEDEEPIPEVPEETQLEGSECVVDSDCATAGCSSTRCVTKEKAPTIITTCVWKESFACYDQTSCGCVNGYCQWKDQEGLEACFATYENQEG